MADKYKYVNYNAKSGVVNVKTPKSYKPNGYRWNELDEDVRNDILYKLDGRVKFLYNCLAVLGISKKEAIEKELTLNQRTGYSLLTSARGLDHVSHEMYMVIKNYNW